MCRPERHRRGSLLPVYDDDDDDDLERRYEVKTSLRSLVGRSPQSCIAFFRSHLSISFPLYYISAVYYNMKAAVVAVASSPPRDNGK